mgnify:FL=1
MSMNVSTTTAAYANYQNNYKTGTANKKKETAQTTENTKLKENTMRPRSSPMWWTVPPSHRFRNCATKNLRREAVSGSCPTSTPGRAAPSAPP